MIRIYFTLIFLSIFCLYSCENPISFIWDVEVSTDAVSYEYPSLVTVTVKNDSENPIDIRMCSSINYYTLQRQAAGEWENVYQTECLEEDSYESLTAGQFRNFTVNLIILDGNENIGGTYRIELMLYPGGDRRVRLPESMRSSNTFTITYAD